MLGLRQMLVAGLVVTGAGGFSIQSRDLPAGSIATARAPRQADATEKLAARMAQATRAAAVAASHGQTGAGHYIFVLTNACDGLFIGTRTELSGKPRSEFEGGGVQAGPVTYRELAGPFASIGAAQEALQRGIAERREFPISVGTKGRWSRDGNWYGLWSPTVAWAL